LERILKMTVEGYKKIFLRILPASSARLTEKQIEILALELTNTLNNRLRVRTEHKIKFGE
jgi:hypothetical protein